MGVIDAAAVKWEGETSGRSGMRSSKVEWEICICASSLLVHEAPALAENAFDPRGGEVGIGIGVAGGAGRIGFPH